MTKDPRNLGNYFQGVDEELTFDIDVTANGDSPTDVTVSLYDITSNAYTASNTLLSGAFSVSGNVITTPTISGLTLAHYYRCEVKYTIDSNVYEDYFVLEAVR